MQHELKKSQHAAAHDALTGLVNHAYFMERVEEQISRAARHGHGFSIMYVDLDRFKAINDRYGHLCGDEVLRQVAQRLRDTVRTSDVIARLGGDEFAVILIGLERREDRDRPAAKVIHAMAQPMTVFGTTLEVGASIGVSTFPDDGQSVTDLIRKADQDMYQAKRRRENSV